MTTNAEFATGTFLKAGDGASPEVFVTIAEVQDISGPTLSMDPVDATSHDSAGWEEVIAGLKSGGEVTFDINYVPTHATHKNEAGGVLKDFEDSVLRNYNLVMPTSPTVTWEFAAFVTSFEPGFPVKDKFTASLTLKISGQPTLV